MKFIVSLAVLFNFLIQVKHPCVECFEGQEAEVTLFSQFSKNSGEGPGDGAFHINYFLPYEFLFIENEDNIFQSNEIVNFSILKRIQKTSHRSQAPPQLS